MLFLHSLLFLLLGIYAVAVPVPGNELSTDNDIPAIHKRAAGRWYLQDAGNTYVIKIRPGKGLELLFSSNGNDGYTNFRTDHIWERVKDDEQFGLLKQNEVVPIPKGERDQLRITWLNSKKQLHLEYRASTTKKGDWEFIDKLNLPSQKKGGAAGAS